MDFKFGYNQIGEVGTYLSEKFREYGVQSEVTIDIPISKELLKKVDEDLYYRGNSDKEFQPADDEVIITFGKLKFIIHTQLEREEL